MAMRIGVGDRVVIEAGYDAYYREVVMKRSRSIVCLGLADGELGTVKSWWDGQDEYETRIEVRLDAGFGADVPARFVRLVERSAAEGEGEG